MAVRKDKQEALDKRKKEFEQQRELATEVAKTDSGIKYFRYLRDLCGFEVTSINFNSTIFPLPIMYRGNRRAGNPGQYCCIAGAVILFKVL